jgi:lipopolysaccharide/colanic/teichoic acid biosynthesis glycosyltransferase
MLLALASNAALAFTSPVWAILLVLQLAFYGAGVIGIFSERASLNRPVASVSYLVRGHWNGLIGAAGYLTGRYSRPWTRDRLASPDDFFIPSAVMAGKRALDVVIAACAFVAFIVLFIPIALAIKLESKGPIFYRQLRVGLRTSSQSRLFYLTKFRTMRADAEARSGAVWASKNDPRITRIGNFLRKTRLDELPQCIDVLRGDMSIVGPRPERPQFFTKLESSIPFYAERTYGLKPGITGLAQVILPYDSSIEDVRAKVLYDHAYAMQLTGAAKWLIADISIIFRTFTVMVLGKGQ